MQGKAEDAGGLTPAKDDNAAMRPLYPRTFARNSDDCYNFTMGICCAQEKPAKGAEIIFVSDADSLDIEYITQSVKRISPSFFIQHLTNPPSMAIL